MPYLVYVPSHEDPFILQDCDSNYLKYFDLWGWRIEFLSPEGPGLTYPVSMLHSPFKEQGLYFIWQAEAKRRLHEEQRKVAELRALVEEKQKEGNGGDGKKKWGRLRRLLLRIKKERDVEELEMKVNYLADLQKWEEEEK